MISSLFNRLLIGVAIFFIVLISIHLSGLFKNVFAACYCVDPVASQCRCTTSADDAGATFPASLDGIALRCDTQQEADSIFVNKNPVCGNPYNPEIIPYCAPVNGRPYEVVCYGTGFTSNTGNIPLDTGGSPIDWDPNTPVVFNGFNQSGFTLVATCWANNFCCSRSDVTCDSSGVPAEPTSCEPQNGPQTPENLALCSQGVGGPGSGNAEGESRIWFSNVRLIAALSTMAQTIMNPKNFNFLYEDTAFSKNATQNERDYEVWFPLPPHNEETSGRIGNIGSLTTRIERHQGIDDSTPVVNSINNNSSVIVGWGSPPYLNPYYPNYQTAACYIPETRNNPGDDLLGAKIAAEMLFTQQFTYEAKGRPPGCIDDGSSYVLPYSATPDCTAATSTDPNICCSGSCSTVATGSQCIQAFSSPPYCPPTFDDCNIANPPIECGYTTPCDTNNDGIIDSCSQTDCSDCGNPSNWTVTCSSLPPSDVPVSAHVEIFDKTPLDEYLLDTILRGSDSLYRRFMPQLADSFQFEDIPSSSPFGANVAPKPWSSSGGGFNLDYAYGAAPAPEIYFPFIGTLDKYWLQGFQTALRPQGYTRGDPIVVPPPGTNPPGPPAPPGVCQEGTGSCSPSNLIQLVPAFTTAQASQASQICRIESGGSIDVINNNCTAGGSWDFSVGLFQINLAPTLDSQGNVVGPGRCPGAFNWQPGPRPDTCDVIDDGTDCSVFNTNANHPITECNAALYDCISNYLDIANQGQYNVQFSYNLAGCSDGTCNWCPWSAAQQCNLCP
jgi:hypothetical protein